jgi:predicted  nucleic acid-binding Zn-ribbon protein
MNKTVQDLQVERETTKKPQTEGKLKIKILRTPMENLETSLTNRIQEMEERISVTEDKIEEIDNSVKEAVELYIYIYIYIYIFQAQSIQESGTV